MPVIKQCQPARSSKRVRSTAQRECFAATVTRALFALTNRLANGHTRVCLDVVPGDNLPEWELPAVDPNQRKAEHRREVTDPSTDHPVLFREATWESDKLPAARPCILRQRSK